MLMAVSCAALLYKVTLLHCVSSCRG